MGDCLDRTVWVCLTANSFNLNSAQMGEGGFTLMFMFMHLEMKAACGSRSQSWAENYRRTFTGQMATDSTKFHTGKEKRDRARVLRAVLSPSARHFSREKAVTETADSP